MSEAAHCPFYRDALDAERGRLTVRPLSWGHIGVYGPPLPSELKIQGDKTHAAKVLV